MKIQYQTYQFRNARINMIGKANGIIDEYMAEGYELTLRQLYYQFVARELLPEKWADEQGNTNNPKSYKKFGTVINDGRLAGEIDWLAIVDRTREIKSNSHWNSASEILQSAADSFALDTRADQPLYIEVWVEKDALAAVLERACVPLDVPWFACKGYVSQSALWRACIRISDKCKLRRSIEPVILYLGDHDPSGIDMSRDIEDRFGLFGVSMSLKRIALNLEQVRKYRPPPHPVKVKDSRAAGYVAEYGVESWELDALDPRTINDLIIKQVNGLTNLAARRRLVNKQERQRKELQKTVDNFDD